MIYRYVFELILIIIRMEGIERQVAELQDSCAALTQDSGDISMVNELVARIASLQQDDSTCLPIY